MKTLIPFLLTATLSYSSLAGASVVVSEEADNIAGKGIGGWTGILLGGAAGGPIGAIGVGLLGAWAGGEIQESAGLSGTAYRVALENGDEKVVRSPRQKWHKGDVVEIVGNRLIKPDTK